MVLFKTLGMIGGKYWLERGHHHRDGIMPRPRLGPKKCVLNKLTVSE